LPWGRRYRRRGRPPKPRRISDYPPGYIFAPFTPDGQLLLDNPIYMFPDEYEALRLTYYLGLTQEEASKRMGVSRGTFWRILYSARRKLVQSLVERRPLILTEQGPPLNV